MGVTWEHVSRLFEPPSKFPIIQYQFPIFSSHLVSAFTPTNMYPSGTVDRCIAPSQAQLALALAIVKSKPAGMDIKGAIDYNDIKSALHPSNITSISSTEHILQMRSHIRGAKNSERMVASDKYFDSVAFWKQAYANSEAAQSKLLDRIYDLEQRNESLLVRLKAEPADMQGEKRKGSSDPGVSGAAKKRAKTARPSTSGIGAGRMNNFLHDVKYEEASMLLHYK
jgi:hypothetical protein